LGVDEVETTERAWRQVARISGYIAGVCLLAGTVLYLLDALDALGASPTPQHSGAGALRSSRINTTSSGTSSAATRSSLSHSWR